jgi:hypothetical protein
MTDQQRLLTGTAGVLAPLLLLASTLAFMANGKGLSEGEVGGTLELWAFVAFGVALAGLARVLEPVNARVAAVVTGLGVLGAAGGAAYGLDAIASGAFHVSVQDVGAGVTPLALRVPGVAFPLALVVLGVALARHELVRPVAAWSLVAAAVLFPAARIPDSIPVAVASDVLNVVAVGSIGLSLLGRARVELRAPARTDALQGHDR